MVDTSSRRSDTSLLSHPSILQSLVGRKRELALFDSLLADETLPSRVLVFRGAPGIGKTALLKQLARRCVERSIPLASLSASAISDAKAHAEGRTRVVLIDDCDDLDGIALAQFAADQAPGTVVVLTTTTSTLLDALPQDAASLRVRHVVLQPLDDRDSEDYLELRGVPEAQREAILEFSQGYPLALSVLTERANEDPDWRFDARYEVEVVQRLAGRLHPSGLDAAQLETLDTAVVCHTVTEDLLSAVLQASADAHALFDWLAGLPFMRALSDGLSMAVYARHILDRNLEWRRPDQRAELTRRARMYYWERMPQLSEWQRESNLLALKFLRRGRRVPVPMWDVQGLTIGPLRPGDEDALLEMVRRFEGVQSARAAEHWLRRQPDAFSVVRGRDKKPTGFLSFIAVSEADVDDRAADPGVDAVCAFLEERIGLRESEQARFTRFLLSGETYQDFSPTQNLLMNRITLNNITTSQLAYTFSCYQEPVKWEAGMTRYGGVRLPEAAFSIDGKDFAIFGHDWRAVPVSEWFESISMLPMMDLPSAWQDRSRLVLDREAFRQAVHDVLDHFQDMNALTSNPLIRGKMVLSRVNPNAPSDERVQALIAVFAEAIDEVPNSAKALRAGDLLRWTYLEPQGTQREVARLLHLPFSTYRNHLAKARELLCEYMWTQEAVRPV